jgi:hypothetical protein
MMYGSSGNKAADGAGWSAGSREVIR